MLSSLAAVYATHEFSANDGDLSFFNADRIDATGQATQQVERY